MAKIVKVKMTRVQNGGKIQNVYTADHQAGKHWRLAPKIKWVAFEGLGDLAKEYCIGVVKDADLAEFIVESNIEEITEQEAETLGVVWRPQVKKILDPSKVLAILDKLTDEIGASLALTQADKDALDPDNAEIGINKSVAFPDRLNDAIGKVNNG